MKVLVLMVFSLLVTSVHASSVHSFYEGLKSSLYLKKTTRGQSLDKHIRITKFSKLARILSPDASATYNDKTNTISLDESLLSKEGRHLNIKSATEILTSTYSGGHKVSTIFHELAHAEIDVFVENKKELTDLSLMHTYHAKLKPLYRKYFRGANPWVVFHEHFAYFRTELIDTLYMDIMDLMLDNGWNPQNGRCYLTQNLKKLLAEGASLGEFTEISTHRHRDFSKVTPTALFVRGKDLDLRSLSAADQITINEAHQQFWYYHLEFYGFPKHLKEVAQSMDKDSRYAKLKKCREILYDQRL